MKDYIIKTLNGMAYGLFATLIIGVIFQQVGDILNISFLSKDLYNLLASLMGVGIALGIGIVLKKDGLQLIMIAIIGAISTKFAVVYVDSFVLIEKQIIIQTLNPPGNPLVPYFTTILSIIILDKILVKKTPVDILIIPLISIILGTLLTLILSLPLNFITTMIGNGVDAATKILPVPMVIIISVSMGMILTAPISSAAIAYTIGISGVAAGAAVVGTSIQMIGFAIQSRRDNKIGTVISVGIGTSMLQFKNIVRKPIIWLPTILSSAIVAPIVYFLGFESNMSGAGMGTSGLVGPLQSLHFMKYSVKSFISLGIIIVLGGFLTYIFDLILFKKGYIKPGDLSIES